MKDSPTTVNLSDTELVRLYRENKDGSVGENAFRQLSLRYVLVIRSKCSDLFGCGLDADDLYQEGMLGLHSAALTYSEEKNASFGTYASVCIRNRVVSAVRKSTADKNRANLGAVSIDELLNIPLPESLEPENALIGKDDVATLKQELRHLLTDKELFVLKEYLDGKSYVQISADLNISVKSCTNAMQRVRRKLKSIRAS